MCHFCSSKRETNWKVSLNSGGIQTPNCLTYASIGKHQSNCINLVALWPLFFKNLFWEVSKFLNILVVKLFPSFCDSDDFKKNKCGYLMPGKCWIKQLSCFHNRSYVLFYIFFIIFPREERLRQYFTTRYDSRHNIFDWDYNMKLSKKVNICCL